MRPINRLMNYPYDHRILKGKTNTGTILYLACELVMDHGFCLVNITFFKSFNRLDYSTNFRFKKRKLVSVLE
jgi:hypothetical protein